MSEYGTEAARTRFMGSDPGYVGFRATRTIYDQVRQQPNCIILLDEIDRADASIQDILLSMLEGQGKDAQGEIVYFTQAVFVMTTNLGQEQVLAAWRHSRERGLTRSQTAISSSDDLRRWILEGVQDAGELRMRDVLRTQIDQAMTRFLALDQNADPDMNAIESLSSPRSRT